MSDVIDAAVVETPDPPPPVVETVQVGSVPQSMPEEKEDIDDISLVGEYEATIDIIDRMISRAGSEGFVKALQKSFATQTAKELKSNVYELVKAVALRGATVAQVVEDLEEDLEELQKEVVDQGRILRDLISKSIVGLSWNLARICLERVQDEEIRAISQAIFNAMNPATTDVVKNAYAPNTPAAGVP